LSFFPENPAFPKSVKYNSGAELTIPSIIRLVAPHRLCPFFSIYYQRLELPLKLWQSALSIISLKENADEANRGFVVLQRSR
jgi:hypothetical protein